MLTVVYGTVGLRLRWRSGYNNGPETMRETQEETTHEVGEQTKEALRNKPGGYFVGGRAVFK